MATGEGDSVGTKALVGVVRRGVGLVGGVKVADG